MFEFLRKAEDVATRWFGSHNAPEISMGHGAQPQDRSLDWQGSSTAPSPPSFEATDAMSRLFGNYSDAPLPLQGSRHRDAPTSREIVAALATDKRAKSETAFRQAFLALGKDPDSAKRFSQDLVAETNRTTDNRTDIVETLISLRNSEAQGGSQELFAAYDQVIQALAKAGTLPSEAYSLNYKGKPDFSGTPLAVTQQNAGHADFARRANENSVMLEASMAAESDPESLDKLQPINFTGPLFEHGVSYSDVKQGGLNDCFLVASMSAVAQQRPDIIQNSINREEKFPDGTLPPLGQRLYGVTFYRKGDDGTFRPVKIFVTSSIATKETGGFFGLFTHKQAAFARASNSDDLDHAEAWPLIYEKAYAKFLGAYRALNKGGQGAEALEEITGMPTREINPRKSSDEQTFQFIDASMRNRHPMVANTMHSYGPKRDDGRRELDLEDGLVSGHQYTVLGVRREGSATLVRVRNPWGTNGKYEGNGEQEISLEKFKQYFTGVTSAG